jgi:hypothetical protein
MIAKMKGGDDAGSDAAIAALPVADDAAAAATDTAPATATTTAPPLTTGTLTAVKPAVKTDGGAAPVVADAGAPAKTDGGPAPTPTPTFTIPTNLFDGGAFRFDAGGFKPPVFPK